MNLGNAKLQSVKFSKPQLAHSHSKQSEAASDDYYSFSDYVSDESSVDHVAAGHWGTPPSQTRSPDTSHENLQSEATLPAKPMKRQRLPLRAPPAKLKVEEQLIRSSRSSLAQGPEGNDISPPTPGIDDTPYIRFAIDQLTADEEVLGKGRQSSGDSSASYPVERIVPDEGLGYLSPRKEPERELDPSREPSLRSVDSGIRDVYIPADPPPSPQYPLLTMITALAFSAIWSQKYDGLRSFNSAHDSSFFIFKFLPQIVGGLILLWLLVIDAAIHRTLPFTVMSSSNARSRSGALFMNIFPKNFLMPRFSYFEAGQPLVGSVSVVFWLVIFTVPLLSSLYQPPFPYIDGQATGRWMTAMPIAWTLVAIYSLLAIALLVLAVHLVRETGLKWDPRTLADVLVLLQRSNNLDDYNASETFSSAKVFRTKLASRSDKLGYWRTSERPQTVFYAIGVEGTATRRYSLQYGKVKERISPPLERDSLGFDIENQRPRKSSTMESLQANIHAPSVRYRHVPWFLRDTFVVAWIVTALVLLVAFLVASFLRHALSHGFPPLLSATAGSDGFAGASFLYSFLPSLLGVLLFLAWQSIDMHFRALQPFANLASPRGTSAEKSLLLDYPACLPLEITLRAFTAGHYKVGYISLISLLSLALPILGGGTFSPVYTINAQQVLILAHLPAFYTLVAFLVLYTLSFLLIFPGRKRHLPHGITTLAEMISFVYQSPLLNDAAFRQPRSKTDLVTRLLNTPHGEHSKAKYAFGIYRGRDGEEHLGVDRLQRPGSGEMLITTGIMR
ncbi:MAG: hypothetical protein M1836_007901 [Candelina mexicana]|nr:MAG: hypothetical protein M1836_007901 [Candelina mexicana]